MLLSADHLGGPWAGRRSRVNTCYQQLTGKVSRKSVAVHNGGTRLNLDVAIEGVLRYRVWFVASIFLMNPKKLLGTGLQLLPVA